MADDGGTGRIPKRLSAVLRPDTFEPFRHVAHAAEVEERWRKNPPWVLANLAHAAYHPGEKIERLLETCGAREVRVYHEQHAQAFLGVWPDRAVVSFRGTKLETRRPLPPGFLTSTRAFVKRVFNVDLPDEYRLLLAGDVLADLMFVKKRCGEADIHQGFLGELEKLWDSIAADLDAVTTSANIPVYATGHSLGGAMATIAGMRRRFTEVVTFGEPRVGTGIATGFRAERHVRYVNGKDPVPSVPPEWWPFCYEHHGEEIRLTDPDGPSVIYDHSIVYYAQNLDADPHSSP